MKRPVIFRDVGTQCDFMDHDGRLYVPEAEAHDALSRELWSHSGDVLIRKKGFDRFTNPNTTTLLEAWDPTEIVVYGVALDVCDKYAIDGFIAHGVPVVHLVPDATKAIHPERTQALVEGVASCRMRATGQLDITSGTAQIPSHEFRGSHRTDIRVGHRGHARSCRRRRHAPRPDCRRT